jgi:flagellar biosynthesis chaperone FliJ
MGQLQHDSVRLAQTNSKLIDKLKNESNAYISDSFVDSLPNEVTIKANFEEYTNKIINHITRLQENDINKEMVLSNDSQKMFTLEQRINQLQNQISDLEFKLNMERNKRTAYLNENQKEENSFAKLASFKNDKASLNVTLKDDKVNKIVHEIKKRFSEYNNESNNSNACCNHNRITDNSNISSLSQIANTESFFNKINYNDSSSSLFKGNSVYASKLNSTSILTDSSFDFSNLSNWKKSTNDSTSSLSNSTNNNMRPY